MKDKMDYLIIGTGNIAKRHIRNLKQLFPESIVGCVSSSGKKISADNSGADIVFSSISDIGPRKVKFAIVASPAPFHIQHTVELLSLEIPVLIEKPLTDCLATYQEHAELLFSHQQKIEIAYNLRYLASANVVKHYLEQGELGKIHTVLIDVGQYLPDWRPQIDYRKTVSAKKSLGGGVLLELSHEIDYITWFFGNFSSVFCCTKNSGLLEIDVEDCADAIFVRKDGLTVNLHMDLLQRTPSRICKIIGERGTLSWDVLKNQIFLKQPGSESHQLFDELNYDKNQMYLDQLTRFAKVAGGEMKPLIGLKQGLRVLSLIDAMKLSSAMKQLVNLESGISQ